MRLKSQHATTGGDSRAAVAGTKARQRQLAQELGGLADTNHFLQQRRRAGGLAGFQQQTRQPRKRMHKHTFVAFDLGPAGASDDLHDTVDYSAVCDRVEAAVAASRFALLEALAERIAGDVLAVDGAIRSVTVSVRKLRPPVAQQLSTSGVRITRTAP